MPLLAKKISGTFRWSQMDCKGKMDALTYFKMARLLPLPLHAATRKDSAVKKVLLVLLLIVIAILLYATTRPNTYHVERSIVINAPAEKIVPMIDDFHQWARWSPWEDLDPNMKRTFSGANSGPGAVYAWEGNRKVGAGQMEIVQEQKPKAITVKLEFLRPMHDTSTTTFLFDQQGSATKVTWQMDGQMTYVSKVMCIFVSMDKMIGKDFEKGLARLKAEAEKS